MYGVSCPHQARQGGCGITGENNEAEVPTAGQDR